jgi:general L-amino acid transport system permease protein
MVASAKRFLTPANLLLAAVLLWGGWDLFDWAVLNAVFRPDAAACHALEGSGACWGVVTEKYRVIFFGRYPVEEQWRPLLYIADACLAWCFYC